ncbi:MULTISPECIES: recombinase RecT [unclassified Aurantimonas]|uniref:recombinase RecT n=1 Tax=unclassified Aurantimonas TaxID=2638230 RepID=UPI002E172711|nr:MULTISPECIES: recombinase RecT [unclassified Aurantimonas]MEC5289441.1 recombinase RecT [Aurantimonas sp. C2-3-R2]MEC5410521.1 recombinase RecT [Aurantimonas sp. C2-4-R8]
MNQIAPIDRLPQAFRDDVQAMEPQFVAALPPQIPVERFMRVVMTAVNSDPALLSADKHSLFEAAVKAAQDGLLPDKRDGAFVIFSGKVQWMPMVGGILKKVRNSGELKSIAAHVVYSGDTFTYELGDEERIEHRPNLFGDRGEPIAVYAVAHTKDGGIYREIMSTKDVEKVRAVSKARNGGPWKEWWDEMARKTVIRRLAKRLPMSSDLDDIIRRDDEMYDLNRREADIDRPPLSARLAAATQHSLTDAREGFDRSFIDGELRGSPGAATGEDEASGTDENTPAGNDEELGSESLQDKGSDPAGSDAVTQPETDETGDVDPADEREEPTIPEADRTKIVAYARDLFRIVSGDAEPSILRDRLGKAQPRWKSDIEKISPEAQGMAKQVFASANAIMKGDTDLETAIAFYAEMLDVPAEDFRRAA